MQSLNLCDLSAHRTVGFLAEICSLPKNPTTVRNGNKPVRYQEPQDSRCSGPLSHYAFLILNTRSQGPREKDIGWNFAKLLFRSFGTSMQIISEQLGKKLSMPS